MANPVNAVKSLYRVVVPFAARRLVDNTRNIVRAVARGEGRERVRFHKSLFWQDLGRHVVSARLANGQVMRVDLRDRGVGYPIYINGEFEAEETALMNDYLKPGMVVVDIGANIGYHTVNAARLVGPSGRVIAFEPDPHNHHLLAQNVRGGRFDSVELHQCALGDRPATMTLHHSHENYGDHRLHYAGTDRAGVEVAVKTLDSVLEGREPTPIDVLKIDVQGYEYQVFAGMQRTLAANAPRMILMEYWPGGIRDAGGDPDGLLDTLAGAGYRFNLIHEGGRLEAIERSEVERHLPAPTDKSDDRYTNLALLKI